MEDPREMTGAKDPGQSSQTLSYGAATKGIELSASLWRASPAAAQPKYHMWWFLGKKQLTKAVIMQYKN